MSVTIRTATAADHPDLATLFRAASLSNDGDREVLLAHPSALELPGDAIRAGHTRVAVDDEEIVGFASAVPTGDGLELEDLFVLPERMREGIGRRLMDDVIDRAARTGVEQVWVTGNPHAMAFYLEVGFHQVGTAETTFGDAPRLVLHIAGE